MTRTEINNRLTSTLAIFISRAIDFEMTTDEQATLYQRYCDVEDIEFKLEEDDSVPTETLLVDIPNYIVDLVQLDHSLRTGFEAIDRVIDKWKF